MPSDPTDGIISARKFSAGMPKFTQQGTKEVQASSQSCGRSTSLKALIRDMVGSVRPFQASLFHGKPTETEWKVTLHKKSALMTGLCSNTLPRRLSSHSSANRQRAMHSALISQHFYFFFFLNFSLNSFFNLFD